MPYYLFSNKKKKIGYIDNSIANRLIIKITYLADINQIKGLAGGIILRYVIGNNKSIWPNAYGIITIFPSGWGAPTIKHEHGVSNIVPVISNEFDNGNYTVNIDFESNAYYECETIDSMEITTSFV